MQTTRPVAEQTTEQKAPSLPAPPLKQRSRGWLRTGIWMLLMGGLIAGGFVAVERFLPGTSNGNSTDARPIELPSYTTAFGHVDVESRIVNLYPVQPGEVVALPVREGQEVKDGEVLLRVDEKQARLQVEAAETAWFEAMVLLEQAEKLPELHEAHIRAQQAAINAAKAELDRAAALRAMVERLFKAEGKFKSKEELDAAVATVRKAEDLRKGEEEKLKALELKKPQRKLDVEKAALEVAARKTLLDQACHTLEKCELKAPGNGTVLRVQVSVGDVLTATPKEAALLFCPKEARIVRAEIQQEDAARVRPGQSAIIEDDARLTGQWRGEVKRVSDWYTQRRSLLLEPRQFNDVRTLECIIVLEDPKDLRIGQRVRVFLGK